MRIQVIDESIPFQLYKICLDHVEQFINSRSNLASGLAASINKSLLVQYKDYRAKVTVTKEVHLVLESADARVKPIVLTISEKRIGGR